MLKYIFLIECYQCVVFIRERLQILLRSISIFSSYHSFGLSGLFTAAFKMLKKKQNKVVIKKKKMWARRKTFYIVQ